MRVSDLTGAALDWAVAMCEEGEELAQGWHPHTWERGGQRELRAVPYTPSTDWAQGGPIIDREGITTICWNKNPDQWGARRWLELDGAPSVHVYGPTPLIAAMRCYCTSKLGDTVEIPEELK